MPVTINFQFEGDQKVISGLQNVANSIPMLLESSLDTAASEIRSTMKDKAPFASGELKESINIKRQSLRREIGPDAPHGFYQEKGITGQKRPPIDKIYKWAMIKGISSSKGGSSRDPTMAAAKAIANKIASSGYKAQEFVKKTYNWAIGKKEVWFGKLADQITIEYQRG